MRSDSHVQQQVLQELRRDPRVGIRNVGVEVTRGDVTLTGTVSGYPNRSAAEVAARRVTGVTNVVNELHVVIPPPCIRIDADIAHALRAALDWDVEAPSERIQASVAGGVVTLQGMVDFDYQRDNTERAACRLKGVRGVVNKLVTHRIV
jgi:osmotically-inducible protein OsmY